MRRVALREWKAELKGWSILEGYQYQDNPYSRYNGQAGLIIINSHLVDTNACQRPRAPRETFISEEVEEVWRRIAEEGKVTGTLVFAQDTGRESTLGLDTYIRPELFVDDYAPSG